MGFFEGTESWISLPDCVVIRTRVRNFSEDWEGKKSRREQEQ